MSELKDDQINRIKKLRPIDDVFFEVFANDKAVCQEMLRTILQDNKLEVREVNVQKDLRNLNGRSVRLDALCTLENGELCNIEVQRGNTDDHVKRAHFNGACAMLLNSESGTKFEELPTVYVIYITEFDPFDGNKTIYHGKFMIDELGEERQSGINCIFVNTKVDDGSDIADLMRCFMQIEVDEPKFPAFTDRMKFLKEDKKGERIMGNVIKEYAEECIQTFDKNKTDKLILKALKKGWDTETICDAFEVDEKRVEEVRALMKD